MLVNVTFYLDANDTPDIYAPDTNDVILAVASQISSDLALDMIGDLDLADVSDDFAEQVISMDIDDFIDMCVIELESLNFIGYVEDEMLEYTIMVDIPLDI